MQDSFYFMYFWVAKSYPMKKIITCLTLLLTVVYCQAQWTVVGGDSTTFPANSSFAHIDTTAGNIWQIGTPQKTFFGIAYSSPFAIMTDTINPYPTNNLSRFTIEYSDSSTYLGDAYLGFWHKYEMDSLMDGGFVEISVDSGATWLNVANPGVSITAQSNFYNNYNVISGNVPAFTGTQANWEFSYIKLQWIFGVLPTFNGGFNRSLWNCRKVMFRFSFKSDNIQTNKAGWIIDDISLRIYDIGGGIKENASANFSVELFPNPVNEQGIIQAVPTNNEHNFTISIYNSTGQIVKTSSLDKNNQYIIKANELSTGIYFYSVKNKNGEYKNGKIIIK